LSGSLQSATSAIPMTGLTPGMMYHYRVVLVTQAVGFSGSTSYSGADQQFSTGGGLGGPSAQPRLEAIAPGGAAGLRLTAPTRRGGPVSLRAPAGSALQYWTAVNGPVGSQTTLVNAQTGLCLDVSSRSLKTRAAVVTNSWAPAPAANSGDWCGRAEPGGDSSTCSAQGTLLAGQQASCRAERQSRRCPRLLDDAIGSWAVTPSTLITGYDDNTNHLTPKEARPKR
jgi:hypothetical protein